MHLPHYFLIGSLWACCLFVALDVQAKQTPEIVIEGAGDALADNIRSYLPLATAGCDMPDWRIKRLFKQTDDKIQPAFKALGYYHPHIEKTLKQTDDCWEVSLVIQPGPRVHIQTLTVQVKGEAADNDEFMQILDKLPLKQGAPLNHGEYESSKQLLQSRATEWGYFDSRLSQHTLQVDTRSNQASVQLQLDSGPRYRFGKVTIHQDILMPGFVEHMVKIKPGQLYRSREMGRLQLALSNSNYFADVEVRPHIGQAVDLRVPITVHLSPRKRHRFSVGVGFDTNTGPRFTFNYENRRINRRGHWMTADLKVSPVLSEIGTEYRIPFQSDRLEYLSFQAGYRREDTKTTKSDTFLIGGRWVELLESGWLETRFLNLSRETFLVSGETRTSLLLVPGFSWSKTVVDNSIRIRKGYTARLEIQGAHESVLSDTSFIQLRGYTKWIHSLGWGARLVGRAELGGMVVSDFGRLPTSYRYYAGGDNSVRGYSFKELGPKDAQSNVVGGRYLATASAEYEHPIAENWGVAVFVDAGNAFNNSDVDLKIGTGVGARWYSPVGLIRLDFAVPLNESVDSFQIHFAMGPEL